MKMSLFDSGVPYQRMLNVSGGIQRYRMMRYVMILGIILVTIFLYVSYYTTPMSAVDSRYPSLAVDNPPPQQPLIVHQTDDNHFLIPPATNTSSTSGGGMVREQVGGVEYSDKALESSAPSEATKDASNSNSDGISNRTDDVTGDTGRGVASEVAVPGSGVQTTNEQERRPQPEVMKQIKTNLSGSDLEKKARSNISIVIPRVETPPKQDVLAKLPARNVTRTPVVGTQAASRNKLTSEVYEPGFMDPAADLCPNNGENIRLLALVHSAPSHVEARYAIRQTWGHYGTRRDIAIGFLVGRTTNATWEANLSTEQFMYGDIVRGNSFDSYDNLTLKTISMMEWAATYCDQAKFLLKVDDDMFLNVPKLLEFTQSHWNDTRQIFGRLAKKWRPIRNKKSKYYVSPALYAPKNFPDFVTGPSYLITTDVVRELYEASLTPAFLKLEDVYMTGIVSEMVGVKRKHVNEFLNRRIAFNPCAIRKAISIHMVKGKEQFDLWKKLLDVDLKCK